MKVPSGLPRRRDLHGVALNMSGTELLPLAKSPFGQTFHQLVHVVVTRPDKYSRPGI